MNRFIEVSEMGVFSLASHVIIGEYKVATMNAAVLEIRTTTMPEEEVRDDPRGDSIRANAYSLLAALLAAPPSEELLALLRGIEPAGESKADGFAQSWQTLRLAGDGVDVETLDDEYHALFIGVGRGEVVPYGSWYLTGFMMDRPLAILRSDLASLGYERRDDVKEPEDHAAALLETMSMIVDSGDVDLPGQRRFFEDHIAPWMGTFFLDLQKAETARFYKAVGTFGGEFMEFERRYLNMMM